MNELKKETQVWNCQNQTNNVAIETIKFRRKIQPDLIFLYTNQLL